MVWTFPDPVPIHREPLYTSRRDLVAKYPTYEDRKSFWRLTDPLQVDPGYQDFSKDYPIILTSGRLVEYEGGGDESSVQQMAWPSCNRTCSSRFIRAMPTTPASRMATMSGSKVRRSRQGESESHGHSPGWIGCRVHALPLRRAHAGRGPEVEISLRAPIPTYWVKPANTAMTYGYDSVTQMQESKCSLCRISKA